MFYMFNMLINSTKSNKLILCTLNNLASCNLFKVHVDYFVLLEYNYIFHIKHIPFYRICYNIMNICLL